MTFSDSIKSCLSKYATMQGRASRSEYWWFMVFNWIVSLLTTVIFCIIGIFVGNGEGLSMIYAMLAGSLFVNLALICPSICVLVRRLHDTGRSGWWYFISFLPLVLMLIPFLGFFLMPVPGLYLIFLLIQGSDEENEYGLPVY